jgi:hypothetical protein
VYASTATQSSGQAKLNLLAMEESSGINARSEAASEAALSEAEFGSVYTFRHYRN